MLWELPSLTQAGRCSFLLGETALQLPGCCRRQGQCRGADIPLFWVSGLMQDSSVPYASGNGTAMWDPNENLGSLLPLLYQLCSQCGITETASWHRADGRQGQIAPRDHIPFRGSRLRCWVRSKVSESEPPSSAMCTNPPPPVPPPYINSLHLHVPSVNWGREQDQYHKVVAMC